MVSHNLAKAGISMRSVKESMEDTMQKYAKYYNE